MRTSDGFGNVIAENGKPIAKGSNNINLIKRRIRHEIETNLESKGYSVESRTEAALVVLSKAGRFSVSVVKKGARLEKCGYMKSASPAIDRIVREVIGAIPDDFLVLGVDRGTVKLNGYWSDFEVKIASKK